MLNFWCHWYCHTTDKMWDIKCNYHVLIMVPIGKFSSLNVNGCDENPQQHFSIAASGDKIK